MIKHPSALALLALVVASPVLAQAQRPASAPPAAAAPALAQPDNTTASYGDWTHRCQQAVGAARVCEIVQALEVQGQRGPIALIAVGRPQRNEPYKLVVQVVPNIALGPDSGARVALGEKDEGVLAPYRRCTPGGCFAEVTMSEDLLKRWRGHGETGQLRLVDAANRQVVLTFSFRGFQAAADALARDS